MKTSNEIIKNFDLKVAYDDQHLADPKKEQDIIMEKMRQESARRNIAEGFGDVPNIRLEYAIENLNKLKE